MGAIKEVVVPDIGDFEGVDVIEILVKPGDTVAAEQSLITLESDKATMDIPAPEPGVVKELRVKVGDKVSQGAPILTLERSDGLVFMQGIENGRAFSFVVEEETGTLSAAVARTGITVSVFGACTTRDGER